MRDLDLASGGPSRSVPALAGSQARHPGLKVSVLYQNRGRPTVPTSGGAAFEAYDGPAPFFARHLRAHLRQAEAADEKIVLHLHGLWSPALHFSARLAQREGWPYLVSTRGMLADWALDHKALRKKLAWRLYQCRDLERAARLVASSAFEQADVAALLPRSRVVAIPNGCGDPPDSPAPVGLLPGGEDTRWALALGRLHPVKGYAGLIEAWASVDPQGWKLAIAGPEEAGYRATLEDLLSKHRLAGKVILLGEVDDLQKWALLAQSEIFVAPSKSENFGMAIAEALRSGTPVITTTGTPWGDLLVYGCGWWIPPGVAELRQALRQATQVSAAGLREMGANGCRLVREKYCWNSVAAQTIALYQSVLGEHRCT